MPESSSDANGGNRDKQGKRILPSWTNSKEIRGNSVKGKEFDDTEQVKGIGDSQSHGNSDGSVDFSKLLDGVVFALSGFVNPERGNLRSQAIEMGAIYKPDWSSDCTLLVCAFANTPKFRQVESDSGTIVSKEWMLECYNKRKLVPIEPYLMHAGKPWRKQKDKKNGKDTQKQVERSKLKIDELNSSKGGNLDIIEERFSPLKIKEWVKKDSRETISWLNSQEVKPERDELTEIAAQGIITCLQDVIESLQKNHGIKQVTEQWEFVPSVVKELAELERESKKGSSLSKDELFKLASKCKRIYEAEFQNQNINLNSSPEKRNEIEKNESDNDKEHDSDETVVMTEEEIDLCM